jgi:hypothetical protein
MGVASSGAMGRRLSLEASPLHALISSIVAASLVGCSNQADDAATLKPSRTHIPTSDGASTPANPDGRDAQPGAPRTTATLYCEGNAASRVRGMNAAYSYDSFAYYTGSTSHARVPPDFELVEIDGDPCARSFDHAACMAEVEHARAQSASWWHYDDFWSSTWTLLLATTVKGPHHEALNKVVDEWYAQPGRGAYVSRPLSGLPAAPSDAGPADGGGVPAADSGGPPLSEVLPVVTIDYIDELIEFLGRIDTPNEAALVMFANGRPVGCAMEQEGEDYIARGSWQISDCPITQQAFELRVTPEGTISQVAVGEPISSGACAGRRPDGLCVARRVTGSAASAEWLAHTAHLEAAAVVAFALLESDLAALGAPESLLCRVRRAAREEMVHAELVGQLATARGAEPQPVVMRSRGERTVLEIALENAVEGCVRECWGALCALYQAQAAQSADVRAVWNDIALDELDHAQLSRDVADWLNTRLTPEERFEVEAARTAAIVALRRELDADVAPSLVTELGLPGRTTALEQFDALTERVFEVTHPANG